MSSVAFLNARSGQCRWPLWSAHCDIPLHQKYVCGAVTAADRSYCTEHARQAMDGVYAAPKGPRLRPSCPVPEIVLPKVAERKGVEPAEGRERVRSGPCQEYYFKKGQRAKARADLEKQAPEEPVQKDLDLTPPLYCRTPFRRFTGRDTTYKMLRRKQGVSAQELIVMVPSWGAELARNNIYDVARLVTDDFVLGTRKSSDGIMRYRLVPRGVNVALQGMIDSGIPLRANVARCA